MWDFILQIKQILLLTPKEHKCLVISICSFLLLSQFSIQDNKFPLISVVTEWRSNDYKASARTYETEKRKLEISLDSGNMYFMAHNRVSLLKYFTFCENCPHLLMDIFSSRTGIPIPVIRV